MAARKTIKHLPQEWRDKIQCSMLINRLESYVKGEIKLEPAQVTAALGLLKKNLPDAQAITISGDKDNPLGGAGALTPEQAATLDVIGKKLIYERELKARSLNPPKKE